MAVSHYSLKWNFQTLTFNLTLFSFLLLYVVVGGGETIGGGNVLKTSSPSSRGKLISSPLRDNLKKSENKKTTNNVRLPNSKSSRIEIETSVDIVGYGEDCSRDGPLCNEALHLICDFDEETCICDNIGGYVHISEVKGPGGGYLISSPSKQVCVRPTSEEKLAQSSIPEKVTNKVKVKAITTPPPKREVEKDIDIVGFGEDCSAEDGLFCDKSLHLVCDQLEETCICDLVRGYMNIDEFPDGEALYISMIREQKGVELEGPINNVCVNVEELKDFAVRQVDALFGTRGNPNPDTIDNNIDPEEKVDLGELGLDENPFFETRNGPERTAPGGKLADIFKEYMALSEQGQGDYDVQKKRLERFRMRRIPYNYKTLTMKNLIVEEILKYGKGIWDWEREGIREMFETLLEAFYDNWQESRLAKELCNLVFNIDQDAVPTHQEYVIVLFSERVRKFVVPNAFSNLTKDSDKDKCIRIDDLRKLKHNANNLEKDFKSLDTNKDGCFSLVEFEDAMTNICNIDWLYVTLYETQYMMPLMDPSPEEMYARRLMQKSRLNSNWLLVDKDSDGLISRDELQSDLLSMDFATEDSFEETDALIELMDLSEDGYISLREAIITISLSNLQKDYQFDWLESLYELYETDEEDVKEVLEMLMKDFDESKEDDMNEYGGELRMFKYFDKNRDGELDMIEFKLLMEIVKKYVLHDFINEIITTIDFDGNKKATLFEYHAVFKSVPLEYRIHSTNILSSLLNSGETGVDEDYDEEENEESTSWTELSSKAAKVNETLIVRLLFTALDENKDGLVTKEDLYNVLFNSPDKVKSDSEIEKEFKELDIDQDGKLTAKDSEEFEEGEIDLATYKTHSRQDEQISAANLLRFLLMDTNFDGVIQKEEFLQGKKSIFDEEERDVVNWLEVYFSEAPTEMDPGGAETFREFDHDRDGFVSETEFTDTIYKIFKGDLHEIRFYLSSTENLGVYFRNLDLNRDKKISYNEFQFLLLRTNKRISER